jgi:hypothetical protein
MRPSIAKVLLLLALVGLGWFIAVGSSRHDSTQSATAPQATTTHPLPLSSTRAGPQTPQALTFPDVDPLTALKRKSSPFQAPVEPVAIQKLRALSRGANIHEAQLDALRTQDPLLFVHALYLNFPCMSEPVNLRFKDAREYLRSITRDPKTGAPLPVSDDDVRFLQLRAASGPQRIYPIDKARQALAAARSESPIVSKRDYGVEMQLWQASQASLRESEQRTFERTRDELAAVCAGDVFNSGFGPLYRETRDALVAQGALSALIFNENAGWTSKRQLSELSERDFALVERGIREQHPDALALLLTRGAMRAELDGSLLPEDAISMQFVGSGQVGWLAACELSVADCGPTSSEFRHMCLTFGGCDQPDLAALWRSVLARDGLNEGLLDQAVARLIHAIRVGDLDALGIGRAKK